MNFTREPIIETIITPKEGCKLVIRNCKLAGGEEFFVDSVQLILLGQNCFYRSAEKPKPFLVPATDYEVLEVRETKMALKLPVAEKGGIKIASGREPLSRAIQREAKEVQAIEEKANEDAIAAPATEHKVEKRKEKKRFRKERKEDKKEVATIRAGEFEEKPHVIIPPPTTLISETIARYKDMPNFASAFFEKDQKTDAVSVEEIATPESGDTP